MNIKHSLEKIVLSTVFITSFAFASVAQKFIPSNDRSLDTVFVTDNPSFTHQRALIDNLPKNSFVYFIARKNKGKRFVHAFEKNNLLYEVIDCTSSGTNESSWAQDAFQIVVSDKKKKIIFSHHIPFSFVRNFKHKGFEVEQLQHTYFAGGNIEYDMCNGKNIVFVAAAHVPRDRTDQLGVLNELKRSFGADTVIISGYGLKKNFCISSGSIFSNNWSW